MTSELAANKQLYRDFIDALNKQDFAKVQRDIVHPDYHEECVGFTPGRVPFDEAERSLKKVLLGIPDLRADIVELVAEDDKLFAKLKASGTQSGWLFGMPPTNQYYQVSMFDYVVIQDGRIKERVQQSDNLGQFGQLLKPTLKYVGITVGVIAGLWLTTKLLPTRKGI